jgi:hypothetical protein
MSLLPLVRIWIWISVLASVAGWLLSALGQLNRVGYAVFCGTVAALLWVGRKNLGWIAPEWSFRWSRVRARFHRWLPAAFAVLAFLILLGGAYYPPSTHEALSCRVPRVLHWLAEGRWHWIHSPVARMNDRPCGLEWLAAPLLLFTRSDRGLFLINYIPFLLLPGLLFSVCTRLGVRPRVAWHWMWLLPTGYNFLLQAGSLGNDTTPAFYGLAAVDFGLRAWKSRRLADLWLSILAAAFLTGAKLSNLPLLLPCAIVVFPLLFLLIRRPASTFVLLLVAVLISFLPTAALNASHSGDWTGLAVERSVIAMKHPLVGCWGNSLLFLKNLAPPIFPLARSWNQTALSILPLGVVGPMVANFEPGFHALGELPVEDTAGIGFGVSALLLISVLAGGRIRSAQASPFGHHAQIPPSLRLLVLLAPWVSLLAYFAKSAMMDLPRHVSAYYPLLLPLLLLGKGSASVVRRRWWRAMAAAVLLLALLVLVLTPGRPLWPAQTILSKLLTLKPNQPLLVRALSVYRVYDTRTDPLANIRALLPKELSLVGFMGTPDDIDISLWRPLGTRRVMHILPSDSPEQIRQRHLQYAVIGEVNLQENSLTLSNWQQQARAEVVATAIATQTVSQGPHPWYVVRFAD